MSFNQEQLSTTWGKENKNSLKTQVHKDHSKVHQRTLSANIPYSNKGKTIHTDLKDLDKKGDSQY